MTGYEPTVWVDNAASPRLNAEALNKIEQGIAAAGSQDSPTFTGNVTLPATTTIGTVSSVELGYLDGVTSGIQGQLNAKAPLASPALTGTPTTPTAAAGTNTTQIASTAYVRTEVANIVNSAPATLDTLNEIAAALGSDPNFATTMTNLINGKVAKVTSTDNAIARFNGVSGEIQNSTVTIDDSGNMTLTGSTNRSVTVESTAGDAYLYLTAVGTGGTINLHTVGGKTRFAQIATSDIWYLRAANDSGELWETGASNPIYVTRSNGAIAFSGNATFNSGLATIGDGTVTAEVGLVLNGTTSGSQQAYFRHGGLDRWRMGSYNGGTSPVFAIQRYVGNAYVDSPLLIANDTGNAFFDNAVNVNGTLSVDRGSSAEALVGLGGTATRIDHYIRSGSGYESATNYWFGPTDTIRRWKTSVTDSAYYLQRFDASGNALSSPLSISNSTGLVTVNDGFTAIGTVTLPSTTSIGNVSSTEIGYLDGVTSAIQTQISGKANSSHTHAISDVTNLQTSLDAKVDEVASTDNAIVRFNGTGGAIQSSAATLDDSGYLTANRLYADTGVIVANGAAGTWRQIQLRTDDSTRWIMYANTTAESGSNAGSDFTFSRYEDDGSTGHNVLTVNRSTGLATFYEDLIVRDEIIIQGDGNPSNGGGGSIRTAGSRYTMVFKPRNADSTYADASEFYYDSTYVGWWAESKMGCSGTFEVNASAYVNGTASADPALYIQSQDGRTPYLVMKSAGANDLYMGWSRGNVTRFYFRCTQDSWSIRSADDSGNIWGSAPYGNVFLIDRTNGRVTLGGHTTGKYEAGLEFGTSGPREMVGTGSPEGAVTAPAGSVWRQTDDSALTYLRWYKATGTGNTGWLPDFEGRWVAWTPTWYSASSPQPSVGNGTNEWFFTRRGNTINVKGRLYWGSSTTNGTGGWTWSLPPGVTTISGERYPQNVTVYTSGAGVHTGWVAWEAFGTDRMALLYGSSWLQANGSNPVAFTNLSRIIVDATFIVTS